MNQKGDDYKLTSIKYYLNNNDTMDNTCKIFDLLKQRKPSLHRWIKQYKTQKNIIRKPRSAISYKITNSHISFIKQQLKQNKIITMDKLLTKLKTKYPDLILSRVRLMIFYSYFQKSIVFSNKNNI